MPYVVVKSVWFVAKRATIMLMNNNWFNPFFASDILPLTGIKYIYIYIYILTGIKIYIYIYIYQCFESGLLLQVGEEKKFLMEIESFKLDFHLGGMFVNNC